MPSWARYNIIDNIFWVLLKSTEIILFIPVVFSFSSFLVLFFSWVFKICPWNFGRVKSDQEVSRFLHKQHCNLDDKSAANQFPPEERFPLFFCIYDYFARRKAEIIKLSVVVAFVAFTDCQWLVTIKQWAYFPATALVFPFPSETFPAFHQKKYTYSATHWDDHCQIWTI